MSCTHDEFEVIAVMRFCFILVTDIQYRQCPCNICSKLMAINCFKLCLKYIYIMLHSCNLVIAGQISLTVI